MMIPGTSGWYIPLPVGQVYSLYQVFTELQVEVTDGEPFMDSEPGPGVPCPDAESCNSSLSSDVAAATE